MGHPDTNQADEISHRPKSSPSRGSPHALEAMGEIEDKTLTPVRGARKNQAPQPEAY